MYLMAAPEARGLFAKAIAQSAYMISAPELRSTHVRRRRRRAGRSVGSPRRSARAISPGLRSMDAVAITDGAAPPDSSRSSPSMAACCRARWSRCSIAASRRRCRSSRDSTAAKSARCEFLLPPAPADAAAYETQIRARYADLAEPFLEQYPAGNFAESMLATTRDALYGWTAERLVAKQTAAGVPSFLYYFDHGYPAGREPESARVSRQRTPVRLRHG